MRRVGGCSPFHYPAALIHRLGGYQKERGGGKIVCFCAELRSGAPNQRHAASVWVQLQANLQEPPRGQCSKALRLFASTCSVNPANSFSENNKSEKLQLQHFPHGIFNFLKFGKKQLPDLTELNFFSFRFSALVSSHLFSSSFVGIVPKSSVAEEE